MDIYVLVARQLGVEPSPLRLPPAGMALNWFTVGYLPQSARYFTSADVIAAKSAFLLSSLALDLVLSILKATVAITIPIIASTTRASIRVNPRFCMVHYTDVSYCGTNIGNNCCFFSITLNLHVTT